jgi:hypothetical protein
MSKKSIIPAFDSYVCAGDTVQWSADGFDITARVEYDEDTKPTDFDCYSARQIEAWRNDKWFFCGIVLSVSRNGVELSDHAASLWGIDCNFPSRRKNPNAYLSDVCAELQEEALETAKLESVRILAALEN